MPLSRLGTPTNEQRARNQWLKQNTLANKSKCPNADVGVVHIENGVKWIEKLFYFDNVNIDQFYYYVFSNETCHFALGQSRKLMLRIWNRCERRPFESFQLIFVPITKAEQKTSIRFWMDLLLHSNENICHSVPIVDALAQHFVNILNFGLRNPVWSFQFSVDKYELAWMRTHLIV